MTVGIEQEPSFNNAPHDQDNPYPDFEINIKRSDYITTGVVEVTHDRRVRNALKGLAGACGDEFSLFINPDYRIKQTKAMDRYLNGKITILSETESGTQDGLKQSRQDIIDLDALFKQFKLELDLENHPVTQLTASLKELYPHEIPKSELVDLERSLIVITAWPQFKKLIDRESKIARQSILVVHDIFSRIINH